MENSKGDMMKDAEELISKPFFSVIITTYNRVELLKRALDSLISQTEKDWEGVIIDDGSTDDTHMLVLSYLKQYPEMKYFRKENNSGEVRSKNKGISLAVGEFVTFLDSDDEFDPVHLEIRKNVLIQNPGCRFLYGGLTILGNQFVPDRYDNSKQINLKDCVIGGTFFVERNALLALKGFHEIYLGADADLFDRAKEMEIEMIRTDFPTYIYHHESEDSITNQLYFNKYQLQ